MTKITELPPADAPNGSEMIEVVQGGVSKRMYSSDLQSAGESAYQAAVSVGYIGTKSAWLLSLKGDTGPQGLPGEPGVQGLPGINGDTGLQGVQGDPGLQGTSGVDGNSAYAVAVSNGYIGTEAAWLLSLKGDTGPQGIQGIDGVPGLKGDPGTAGSQGIQGEIGPEGLQGIQGPAGANGVVGNTDALVEGVVNLYFTAARVRSEFLMQIKNLTADYTVLAEDIVTTVLRFASATPVTLTLPIHAADIPVGACILISGSGIGAVTIVGASGVTVQSPSGFIISKLHGKATALKVADNSWDIEGNLTLS